ncbi:MAG: UvrD-helicase domain-containing protein [Rhodospirillales bacterium]|nr:UvrD-helicase domain-containing protein [Alphaproteobacteria bacterium]MBL6948721.1 UvrD-helicase domain-containing protein [Rhodospirillales bacterium]
MNDLPDLTEPEQAAPSAPQANDAAWYLDSLNETQREAVESLDGPLLVLAGAGTGKTRVLITRLAHILMQGRAHPGEILAVTFTNKAAREMKERVAGLVNRPVEGWWVGTFHATGARILRTHAELIGLKNNFTILDADDQVRLIKQVMERHDIDDKKFPARAINGIIQRWKDRGLTPEQVPQSEAIATAGGGVVELYADYQDELLRVNAADFGDLLLHGLSLFKDNPDVLRQYQKRFRYLLVDEYQDTNVAQYLWLRLLAQEHGNICCVGDDDQSIYSWRGAEVENILRFEKDFPGAGIVRLERNYRSTPHILATASGLIAHNEGRHGKTLWTDLNDGEKVRVTGVWDGEEEARVTGDEIEALHTRQQPLNGIAVLVRAGFQTREFEERLITLGVPYRVIGGPRFYERQEIRDAVAYLRVLAQPDDDLAFERIVNLPKRGLGPATMQTLHRLARADRIALTRAAEALVETDEIKPKARGALAGVLKNFARWRKELTTEPHPQLAARIFEESGYLDMWRARNEPDAPGRIDNVKELVVALEDFSTLAEFLEHVSLVMENDDSGITDKVNLMTIHGAKGLEFDTVFLAGWEEGLFPHPRTLDDSGEAGLEEERRLAYVGLTRARKQATVSFAANRRIHGQWQSAMPSRFIDELPAEHIDMRSASGLYGASRHGGGGSFGQSREQRKKAKDPFADHFKDEYADGFPDEYSQDGKTGEALTKGARVFHQKFGYGKVKARDGDKLEIAFEKAGIKKVMASFVEPV